MTYFGWIYLAISTDMTRVMIGVSALQELLFGEVTANPLESLSATTLPYH